MMAWLDALQACARADTPAVLVTLLVARGSTPREAGCKMVVTADATHGTIGGGNLEYQSIALARTLLERLPLAPVVRDFPLGPALGQCCGGHASVLFEPMQAVRWQIAVYGAGHVGRALVNILATLDCRVRWIDGRDDTFPEELPANVTPLRAAPPASLPRGTQVLVMTHDHALDYALVAEALPRTELPFVGLIGSETKRARFTARLTRQGIDARRLVCPIGVSGAGGKAPAEIAISVAAQLLQVRDEVQDVRSPAPVGACAGCGVTDCVR
jgi:xanthine dehydrogenase accessory factor